MHAQLEQFQSELSDLRKQLIEHPLYGNVKSIADFRAFMEQHIFAVWDFMSLLKSLQRNLTCVELPWQPKGNPVTRRFINEIVLGEESDVDADGKVASHFEMYLEAMEQIGANTTVIKSLLMQLNEGKSVNAIIQELPIEKETKAFVEFTFACIQKGQTHEIAAVFTFGREDLIPEMFIEILRKMKSSGQENVSKLLYYLERHIEVDGDDHGPVSLKMMEELCGEDEQKWEQALSVAKEALTKRIQLWNGVLHSINN